jgi:glycosyltransferase involved in cell wall biosynthesis
MKLIFDCRFIRTDHHDGISRFSAELFEAVSKLVPTTALISDRKQLSFLPEGAEYIVGNSPTNGLKEIGIARLLNDSQPTHVFSPMQTMGSWGRRYKLILTLHDLIYYKYPKAPTALPWYVRFAWRIYHLSFWPVRLLLNRADAVVTVSETSKLLIKKHSLTVRPVHVVYNAPNAHVPSLAPKRTESVNGKKQLVYMGSFMPYKNVECLIEAIKVLPDFELVLLSKISEKRKLEFQRQAGIAADRIVFLNGVSDDQYRGQLESAFALVSASKDEGFGIPLVEAMRCGVPLIVSDIPIFREVASDAALYFDPANPSEFQAAVDKLFAPTVWEKASAKSCERAKFFSWDESAKSLLKAFE